MRMFQQPRYFQRPREGQQADFNDFVDATMCCTNSCWSKLIGCFMALIEHLALPQLTSSNWVRGVPTKPAVEITYTSPLLEP